MRVGLVPQRRGCAQSGVRCHRHQQRRQVALPVPAGIEPLHRGERGLAVCEASPPDHQPALATPLQRDAHGAGDPCGGPVTSTAKAMLLTCARESRSMTWITRR
jgi:hypothetical protein